MSEFIQFDGLDKSSRFYYVSFMKLNGDIRNTICTVDPLVIAEYLPPGLSSTQEKSSTRASPKKNPDVQRAFFLEKMEWRSFRKDRVLVVKPIHDVEDAEVLMENLSNLEKSIQTYAPYIRGEDERHREQLEIEGRIIA